MTDHEAIEENRRLLHQIHRILQFRWWLFSAIAVTLLVNSIATCSNTYGLRDLKIESRISAARSVENKAAIEAAIQQQIAYQQQVSQYMDYMSSKNPKIKVPRAVVRPPTPGPFLYKPIPNSTPINTPDPRQMPFTDAELARSPSRTSTVASKREKKVKSRPRPTATPKLIDRIFKPKSTR